MLILVETESRQYKPRALPQEGEVWLFLQSGMLYEMRKRDTLVGVNYRSCHRVGAPETGYGCDACWDTAVYEG
jgi:hypothetical protein